jgi:hypothetical protein
MIFHRPEAPLPPPRLTPSSQAEQTLPKPTGILLGQSTHWDPHALPNPHVIVIGASGSGKTQTLKAMAHELANYGRKQILIIDFHGDQSLPEEVVYPLHMASPHGINPLTVNPDPEGGGPHLQAIQVAMLIRKALTLGPIQEGHLLETLKEIYLKHGILQSEPATWQQDATSRRWRDPPTFAHLEKAIQERVEAGSSDYTKLQIKPGLFHSKNVFECI